MCDGHVLHYDVVSPSNSDSECGSELQGSDDNETQSEGFKLGVRMNVNYSNEISTQKTWCRRREVDKHIDKKGINAIHKT